jgi:hypothetical protein
MRPGRPPSTSGHRWTAPTPSSTPIWPGTEPRLVFASSRPGGSGGTDLYLTTRAQILPTTKEDCKQDGWQYYGVFKNQGDCVSFVATSGANAPG